MITLLNFRVFYPIESFLSFHLYRNIVSQQFVKMEREILIEFIFLVIYVIYVVIIITIRVYLVIIL